MLNGEAPFDPAALFRGNVDAIRRSAALVAILDGADADSGTCWECGFAYALGIPVIAVRTDIRQSGDDGALNLMLTRSCRAAIVAPLGNRTDLDTARCRLRGYVRRNRQTIRRGCRALPHPEAPVCEHAPHHMCGMPARQNMRNRTETGQGGHEAAAAAPHFGTRAPGSLRGRK
jgi:hypothetical protein